MAYDDTSSRRSYGRPSRGGYDEYDDYRGDDRRGDDRRSDGRGRDAYYNNPPPVDNSALARREQLPAAYYDRDYDDDRSVRRSARSNRTRSRSITPPRKATTKKGDIISGVAGAIALTAADKFLIEPRTKKGHGRSKSHHEALRRAADIGVGGIAGTSIYRAVSRNRARSKAKKARSESRPGSPDSRGRSDSRGRDGSRERSKSQIPWKSLLSTVGGGIAGLAAEQIKKRSDSNKGGRDRSVSSSDSDRSRRNSRRHRSADDDDRRSRGGHSRRDYSDDGYSDEDDYDRRDRRRRRRDRDTRSADPRGGRPRQNQDLMAEAIGLLGTANGIRGKDKQRAALETAIGAAGMAHKYYQNHNKNRPTAAPPR